MPGDLYEVLGVSPSASDEEIKRVYKKLCLQHHPDKNPGGSEERFKEISAAYQVLGDPEKRRMYDATGSCDGEPGLGGFPGGFPFNDMFQQVFNFGFGGGGHPFARGQQPGGGGDHVRLALTIEDVIYGCDKTISLNIPSKCGECDGKGSKEPSAFKTCLQCNGTGTMHMRMGPLNMSSTCRSCAGKGKALDPTKACPTCHGNRMVEVTRKLEINVPKGVRPGASHRVAGQGSFDEQSGRNRDIVIEFFVNVDPNKYKIEGLNVHISVDLSLQEVVCGFIKRITVYREELLLVSKEYFDPNRKVVVKGMGLPPSGDLVISFNTIFPKTIPSAVQNDVWKSWDKPDTSKETGAGCFKIVDCS